MPYYSAFSANTNGSFNQPLDGTLTKVFFQNEIFDLADEYDPSTSVFTPKHSGVYLLNPYLVFTPNNINVNYQVRVQIRVNGTTIVADDEFTGGGSFFALATGVTSIVHLNAGDRVEVFASSTVQGVISPGVSTRFEGARFPSQK